ncbi:hypothetical protein [Brasilonema sp. UFV-L1]|uniref:DUF6887 family protein n=1 Tax=Brasilonema sp. UFV-L1 TaxID=2234130 RepID=UPI00145D1E15|nr:hypothetical protein [Brasilonema sp. UFV-L1]NMG07591.1 hypothetical protein [Brasilonema sp. UFV-L1]
MTKPNFEAMSRQQLREYILIHRDDDDAIHAMVLLIQKEGKTLNSIEELEQIIHERRQQHQ